MGLAIKTGKPNSFFEWLFFVLEYYSDTYLHTPAR